MDRIIEDMHYSNQSIVITLVDGSKYSLNKTDKIMVCDDEVVKWCRQLQGYVGETISKNYALKTSAIISVVEKVFEDE